MPTPPNLLSTWASRVCSPPKEARSARGTNGGSARQLSLFSPPASQTFPRTLPVRVRRWAKVKARPPRVRGVAGRCLLLSLSRLKRLFRGGGDTGSRRRSLCLSGCCCCCFQTSSSSVGRVTRSLLPPSCLHTTSPSGDLARGDPKPPRPARHTRHARTHTRRAKGGGHRRWGLPPPSDRGRDVFSPSKGRSPPPLLTRKP